MMDTSRMMAFVFVVVVSTSIRLNAREVDHQEGIVGGSREWLEDIEYIHSADVYDSLESAMKRVAAQTIQQLAPSWDRTTAIPIKIVFRNASETKIDSFTEAGWLRCLQQASSALGFSDTDLLKPIGQDSDDHEFAELRLNLTKDSGSSQTECLTASLEYRGNTNVFSPMNIVDKPWVQSFGQFRNENPNKKLIQFRGNTIADVEQAALEHIVDESVARPEEPHTLWDRLRSWHRDRRDIRSLIMESGMIVDRFTQSFPLNGVDVESDVSLNRCAILVDLSSSAAERVKAKFAEWKNRDWHDTWVRRRWLGALLCGVGILYVFANSATKGYYVWQLRGGACLMTALLALVLV
jgi:hypothetical protein